MPVKFENAALFLRFGLPSTLIRHASGSFSKTLFKPEEFELKRRLPVWTRVDGQVFKKGFSKTMTLRKSRDFPGRVFLKNKSKYTADCCVVNLSDV